MFVTVSKRNKQFTYIIKSQCAKCFHFAKQMERNTIANSASQFYKFYMYKYFFFGTVGVCREWVWLHLCLMLYTQQHTAAVLHMFFFVLSCMHITRQHVYKSKI